MTYFWSVALTTWYNSVNDTLKVESSGQEYYDLLPNAVVIPANTQTTIWAGSNYNLSATWSWILHPNIKRAKYVQVWWNFAYSTEVKVYSAPIDSPDQTTPEYSYKWVTEQSWAFIAKDGTSTVANTPACGRIMPISCNALKFYVKNTDVSNPETVTFYIRLIF